MTPVLLNRWPMSIYYLPFMHLSLVHTFAASNSLFSFSLSLPWPLNTHCTISINTRASNEFHCQLHLQSSQGKLHYYDFKHSCTPDKPWSLWFVGKIVLLNFEISIGYGLDCSGSIPGVEEVEIFLPVDHSACYKMSTRAFHGLKEAERRTSHPTSP